jgi:hypothetical protein
MLVQKGIQKPEQFDDDRLQDAFRKVLVFGCTGKCRFA